MNQSKLENEGLSSSCVFVKVYGSVKEDSILFQCSTVTDFIRFFLLFKSSFIQNVYTSFTFQIRHISYTRSSQNKQEYLQDFLTSADRWFFELTCHKVSISTLGYLIVLILSLPNIQYRIVISYFQFIFTSRKRGKSEFRVLFTLIYAIPFLCL